MLDADAFSNENPAQIRRFIAWLDDFGETSHDHQSFYAGPLGSRAKRLYYSRPLLGTFAVLPIVLLEAVAPESRRLFWKRQRFPIADAHFAMAFAYLYELTREASYYQRAVNFLHVLIETRAPAYDHFCWGYPFDWVTRNGTVPANTPLITSTPYAYEAFDTLFCIDHNNRWLEIMQSIAEHAAYDIEDFRISEDASTCGYFPGDMHAGVVNASAYRAFLLFMASRQFNEKKYWNIATKNLGFVLGSQQENGSWYYAMDGVRSFVDHYHTCFVLKALSKIEKITQFDACRKAIEKGVEYYVRELFDARGMPKPFAIAPRSAICKTELYDCAECINLGIILKYRFPMLDERARFAEDDVLRNWVKKDGSFRARRLHVGWDNVPMHRWGQAQMFRALCLSLLSVSKRGE